MLCPLVWQAVGARAVLHGCGTAAASVLPVRVQPKRGALRALHMRVVESRCFCLDAIHCSLQHAAGKVRALFSRGEGSRGGLWPLRSGKPGTGSDGAVTAGDSELSLAESTQTSRDRLRAAGTRDSHDRPGSPRAGGPIVSRPYGPDMGGPTQSGPPAQLHSSVKQSLLPNYSPIESAFSLLPSHFSNSAGADRAARRDKCEGPRWGPATSSDRIGSQMVAGQHLGHTHLTQTRRVTSELHVYRSRCSNMEGVWLRRMCC
jgi:hypothetical protein